MIQVNIVILKCTIGHTIANKNPSINRLLAKKANPLSM